MELRGWREFGLSSWRATLESAQPGSLKRSAQFRRLGVRERSVGPIPGLTPMASSESHSIVGRTVISTPVPTVLRVAAELGVSPARVRWLERLMPGIARGNGISVSRAIHARSGRRLAARARMKSVSRRPSRRSRRSPR